MDEGSFFAQNLDLWMSVLLTLVVVLIGLLIYNIYYTRKLKTRYETFMGQNKYRKNDVGLEKLLVECVSRTKTVDEKYTKVLETVQDMQKNMEYCCQKVGIVRYNPFEEMGGNLCFAVAILNAENTGIVINGIHSRTGTFTYAKPVELGVSTYILSKEEQEAIDKAVASSYQASKEPQVKETSKETRAKKRTEKVEETKKKAEIYKNAVKSDAAKKAARKKRVENKQKK